MGHFGTAVQLSRNQNSLVLMVNPEVTIELPSSLHEPLILHHSGLKIGISPCEDHPGIRIGISQREANVMVMYHPGIGVGVHRAGPSNAKCCYHCQ